MNQPVEYAIGHWRIADLFVPPGNGYGRSILVYTNKSVDAYTNGSVQVHAAANDDDNRKDGATLAIGDRMPDGTVYAGISPDSNNPLYATPADAPLTYTFNEARKYASKLDAHGHQDWRVPTKKEMNVLFNNRAAIVGFDESGSVPAGWYWSSSQTNYNAWGQRFSDRRQLNKSKGSHSAVRCVP